MKLPAHKTKIVCTIGPASRSEALLERLMLQGMNVARLNFAHGTLQGHREDIGRIRAVASRLQRHFMIMVDLPGPKIRIGKLLSEPLLLEKGKEVILTVKELVGTPKQEIARKCEPWKPDFPIPAVQKKLIHKANLLGRPVITATQMLLSMTENIRPTRAEVSDVANAILDGTDAVMLSEETTIGRYPVEAVEMISKIATSVERERKAVKAMADLPAYFRTSPGSDDITVEDIVSLNAVESANALNVRYIMTHTKSKGAPCLISRFKPDCWILSRGGDEKTNNFLALPYGVHPVCREDEANGFADMAMRFMGKAGMIEEDEKVILVEDESTKDMHRTDLLKIIRTR